MTTQFVDSAHNFRIAYEIQGSGPVLLLVHGFNNDRTMWREHGWIDQLQATFTLIYTGTNDGSVVEQLRQQQVAIEEAGQRLHIFDGFDHRQLVSERAVIAPLIRAFLE